MSCTHVTRSIYRLVFALTFCFFASRSEANPSVSETIDKVQTFYSQIKDLKGNFKQVYTDSLYDRKRTSYGYLYVKKPGMMRWNYVKPERKAFIADGKELWVWEPEDKQAFRNPLSAETLSSGLTFLLGTGDLRKEFEIKDATDKGEQLGGPDDLLLRLEPRSPTASFQYLLLAVSKTNHAVIESMVVNQHSKNHFIFTNLMVNT
ncbi:MAG: outer membrane lipoprotein carrier protein LolA, partial [Pseudomonadota bacterium]